MLDANVVGSSLREGRSARSDADLVFLRKLIGSDTHPLGEEVTGATPDLKCV